MVSFDHLDPGTPELEWSRSFAAHALPPVSLDIDGLLIVAAHPDDESLGAAGLACLVGRRKVPVRLLVVSDGEASHPRSSTHAPERLARIRRREVRAAIQAVCANATVRHLGIPDGGMDGAAELMETAVRAELDALAQDPGRVLVVAPWEGDGHHDHRVVGAAARAAADGAGAIFRGYPVWLWHWGGEADAPWEAMEAVVLDRAAQEAKRSAIAAHTSQVAPLSDAPGDEAILHPAMQEHFSRPFEIFVRPEDDALETGDASVPVAHFDEYFRSHDDPWGFESRWYEQRKRELLLAALPRARYAAALELGCANGVLTARLAERCERLVAVDFSEEALRSAREALAGRAGVELRAAELPHDWPVGSFDLIVFSEIGYFWNPEDLGTAIARMRRGLRPGGHLVACHWRRAAPGNPLRGDEVHRALRSNSRLHTLVLHEEEDFLLEVFASDPALSVARETGIVP